MMTTCSLLDASVVLSAIIVKKKHYEAWNLYFLVPYVPLLLACHFAYCGYYIYQYASTSIHISWNYLYHAIFKTA